MAHICQSLAKSNSTVIINGSKCVSLLLPISSSWNISKAGHFNSGKYPVRHSHTLDLTLCFLVPWSVTCEYINSAYDQYLAALGNLLLYSQTWQKHLSHALTDGHRRHQSQVLFPHSLQRMYLILYKSY
ncbi:hypothetical protein XENTR_v10002570 [Xenopus tropicalis]|nr:hypothetical protein XENTR_v10002570 [Xenopus tropicalis]